MQRVILFVVLAAFAGLTGLLPFSPSDAAKLVVVETLVVSQDAYGRVTLYGPDGLTGTGTDFDDAVAELAAHAPGQLFLGAAEHLVFAGGAIDSLAGAAHGDTLRPAVRVYVSAEPAEVLVDKEKEVTKYLSAHPGAVRLSDVRAALYERTRIVLPQLLGKEGSYETV